MTWILSVLLTFTFSFFIIGFIESAYDDKLNLTVGKLLMFPFILGFYFGKLMSVRIGK
jgi:hypothetical protein